MLDELFCQFKLMKEEINEVKNVSKRNFELHKQLLNESSSNFQQEFENLKKEINRMTQDNISVLKESIIEIKKEMLCYKEEDRAKKQEDTNYMQNLQEEIRKIKEEIAKFKEDQEAKVDREYLIEIENNRQACHEKYENEKNDKSKRTFSAERKNQKSQ